MHTGSNPVLTTNIFNMTLESQYQQFIEKNPSLSHWTFEDWLRFRSDQIGEHIKKITKNNL